MELKNKLKGSSKTFNFYSLLDCGHVFLYSENASDLSVVNAARVSYNVRHEKIEESDVKLITYLMKSKHGSPFEHNMFTFDVKAPIFIFREWMRHRIGSFNEMSARYTELPAEWYIPEPENVRQRVGKPGHYNYEPVTIKLAKDFCEDLNDDCILAHGLYKKYLEIGIAPEQARMFLHVNHYSQMFWTVNARSLMNFLNLRNAPAAQWEIQQYAQAVEDIFRKCMPITHQAFIDNGRVAP